MSLCKHFSRIKSFYNFLNINKINNYTRTVGNSLIGNVNSRKSYSTEAPENPTEAPEIKALMEFFDAEDNWGEKEVRVGRAWKVEELRIKSNSDLHKLWYILIKERNMLMTMQHECNRIMSPYANPERLDKVHISMENIETVVRERNIAYHLLETGDHGERPCIEETNCFGLQYPRYLKQNCLEKQFNTAWQKEYDLYHKTDDHKHIREFLNLYNEKKAKQEYAKKMANYGEVCGIFKRFPNVDIEAVKEQYPEVDVEKAREDKMARGHWDNNVF